MNTENLYFKNYDTFINEGMENKLKKIKKDIDKTTDKISKTNNSVKKKKLEDELEKLKTEYAAVENVVNKGKVSDIDNDIKKTNVTDNSNSDSNSDSNSNSSNSDNSNSNSSNSNSSNSNSSNSDSSNSDSKTADKTETKETNKTIKITDKVLQAELNKWNTKYSQSFKFNNNMPKQVGKESTIQELLTSIKSEYKSSVKDSITSIVKILSHENFKNQEIVIAGFTSTTATESYNQDLSERRAKIVANVIKQLMNEKNIENYNNVKFKEIGYGENKEYLIVKNDTSKGDKPIIKQGVTISDEILKGLEFSQENRQALNRRVKISLPNYLNIETPIKSEYVEIEDEEDNKVEKPTPPEGDKISFNLDSYILTENGENTLKIYVDKLNLWNKENTDNKILELYISSHTMRFPPKEGEKMEQDKLLSYLSCNRAITVKNYIKTNSTDDINIHLYPVVYLMGEKKEINISTEYTNTMETANKNASKVCELIDLNYEDKDGLQYTKYIKNIILRNQILSTLKKWNEKNIQRKKIPLELWYDKGELQKYGLGNEEDFENYKNKIIKIFKRSKNKPEDYVYKVK